MYSINRIKYQKIIYFLGNGTTHSSKSKTRNCVEIIDNTQGTCNTNN